MGGAPTLAAQRYWRSSFFPYVYYRTTDGFTVAAHYGLNSPLGFVERPEPNRAAVNLDAGAGTAGTWFFVADAHAPVWWDGWRARLTVAATRLNRLGYYGVGNDTHYSSDSANLGAYYYRVSRTRLALRATVQRRLLGPLRLLAGGALVHTDFRALPGANVYKTDLANGTVDSGTVPFTDGAARIGIVLDTRDNEVDPRTGVFLDAVYASGTGYTRTTAHARAFVRPVRPLVLAGRLAVEDMGGHPPLAAVGEMEASELPFVAVGGYRSLRGYYEGRFTGPGKLIGGLEARYEVWAVGDALQVKLVAFYDAGRVFDTGEAVRLTTTGFHKSGGGEIAVRVLRNALMVAGYAHGADGGRGLLGLGWSY